MLAISRLPPRCGPARGSWRAHRHGVGCEHPDLEVVVRVERHPDGGWRSSCSVCATTCSYWFDPERWERRRDRTMVRVSGAGPVRFSYLLAADDA
jgi:hypothetical protein